jgi:hypothetical protein
LYDKGIDIEIAKKGINKIGKIIITNLENETSIQWENNL